MISDCHTMTTIFQLDELQRNLKLKQGRLASQEQDCCLPSSQVPELPLVSKLPHKFGKALPTVDVFVSTLHGVCVLGVGGKKQLRQLSSSKSARQCKLL